MTLTLVVPHYRLHTTYLLGTHATVPADPPANVVVLSSVIFQQMYYPYHMMQASVSRHDTTIESCTVHIHIRKHHHSTTEAKPRRLQPSQPISRRDIATTIRIGEVYSKPVRNPLTPSAV